MHELFRLREALSAGAGESACERAGVHSVDAGAKEISVPRPGDFKLVREVVGLLFQPVVLRRDDKDGRILRRKPRVRRIRDAQRLVALHCGDFPA